MNPFKLCVHFVVVDCFMLHNQWASLMAQLVKNPPAMQETWVQSLGWEDLLEEGMETHSSILAWRIPWTEEPDELSSMGTTVHGGVRNQRQGN